MNDECSSMAFASSLLNYGWSCIVENVNLGNRNVSLCLQMPE